MSRNNSTSLLLLLLIVVTCVIPHAAAFRPSRQWGLMVATKQRQHVKLSTCTSVIQSLRAGATDVEDGGEEDDQGEQVSQEAINDEEEDEEEEDDAVEEEDDEEEEDEDGEEEETSAVEPKDTAVTEYDEMLIASPSMQMYSVIGVMLLSRKLDMFNPTVVRAGRFLYIAYIIILQVFLLYVRLQAKSINNRTPIQMSNPFSKILESTQNSQVKSLASSLLTSQSTILEYDLAQIKSMNGGLLMNMAFLWFLHYKMGQTQPLFLQSVQGFMNLYYSPLFQVYVLGRNLERPFKNPTMSKLMAADTTTIPEDEEPATDATKVVEEEEDEESEDSNDEEEDDVEVVEEKDSKVEEEEGEEDDVNEAAEDDTVEGTGDA